jgi:lipoic acid synthetase
VARYSSPEEFESLRGAGLALGLAHVEAGPLVRSSYHARQAADAVPVALGPRMSQAV